MLSAVLYKSMEATSKSRQTIKYDDFSDFDVAPTVKLY